MSERRKQNYEAVALEILLISEADVITTSVPDNTKYVDQNTDSWVDPNAGEWQ